MSKRERQIIIVGSIVLLILALVLIFTLSDNAAHQAEERKNLNETQAADTATMAASTLRAESPP